MTQSKYSDPGTQTTDTQWTALVRQARDGNRFAFDQLIDRFQGDIFRMIYYRTRSQMDAEDLTQDVFMRAIRNIARIKEPDRFRSWLFSIAVNRVHDFLRQKRFRALFKASDESIESHPSIAHFRDQPEALDHVLKEDFWRQVGLILDKLSSMEREVFLLKFLDHLNIKEISKALRKSESTVKTHLYRALAKFKKEQALRQFLQEETA